MRNLLTVFLGFFMFCGLMPAQKVVDDGQIAGKFEEYFGLLTAQGKFSGAFLVSRDGKTVFSKAYGLANQEYQIPNTPQTVFRIGSLTKQFTALAVMQLADKNLLKVEDAVSTYFPDYPHGSKITIHQLLSHRSGLPREKGAEDALRFLTARQVIEADKEVAKSLLCEPGSDFSYSNIGYNLLAGIVEVASGKDFATYVRENILTPLGMNHSGFFDHQVILPQRAYGYRYDESHRLVTAECEGFRYIGSGSLYSTVEDLALWEEKQTGLVSPASLAKIRTPYSKNGTGYGIQIISEHNQPAYLHTGGLNGYLSYLMRLETDRINVVLLSNMGDIPLLSIIKDINAILFGEAYELPKEKTRVVMAMDPAKYQRLVGDYQLELDKNQIFKIVLKNNRLFMLDPDQVQTEIFPEGEWRFFADPKSEDSIEFVPNEQQTVSHLNLIMMGGAKLKAGRIK